MNEWLTGELNKLALTHRILEMEGHGDMTQGHLSLRDPDGRGFWMKRHGIGIGEVLGEDDFVLLDFEGRKLSGSGKPHSEWPIHSEILRNRPEISVVAHTHPFYSGIFSATDEPLRPLTLDGSRFTTDVPHHKGSAELVNTIELGQDLAQVLGGAYAVFLGNHGVTFVGRNIEQALLIGLSVERAAHAQLVAAASGLATSCPDEAEMEKRRASGIGNETIEPSGFYRQTFDYYARKLRWAERLNAADTPGYFRL
jgi:L-fuculose-phosphate aldolase